MNKQKIIILVLAVRWRRMTREELSTILENHKHWINEDCEGWENMKANLCGADLRDAYLRDADLRGAYLWYANLRGTNLCDADLCGANLRYADLRGTNLCGADLRDADLCGTYLCDAKNLPFIPYVCPDTGSFIGYKKASNMIIKLEITEDAKRTSATSRKCRCNKAKVLGIYDYNHNLLEDKEVASDRDKDFIYRVGEVAEVKDFDEDRWNECSTGIHFFINFEEAVNYRG